ncbi:hypothetical protein [Halosegnis marinus]|uniref:hypothetical protein n=1 Tax=Halosegnis marinus TaxID=3034023 RepID=UPI00361E3906
MSDDPGTVVVTTGHTACLPCLRSLGSRGIRTVVAGDDARTPEFASRFCDERVVTPPHDGDLLAYRDALLGLAARPDVRTLVPTREEDAYLLARYPDLFDRYIDTVSPPRRCSAGSTTGSGWPARPSAPASRCRRRGRSARWTTGASRWS